MKNYVVVGVNDSTEFYLVNDLEGLIREMYECELFDNEFDVVKGWFLDNYKVFVSNSDIIELVEE